jgi:hypothetical protein
LYCDVYVDMKELLVMRKMMVDEPLQLQLHQLVTSIG